MNEAFRVLTLVMVLIAMCWLPGALTWRVPGRRTLLILLALELQFLGAAIVIVEVFHEPIVWYRTPRIFVSAVLAVIYCAMGYSDRARGVRRV